MMIDFEAAVRWLQSGDLVVYPTDTLYALGALIANESAVQKIYKVKGRPYNCPLPVAVADITAIDKIAIMNKQAQRLARFFLPGPLTLVLRKRETVPPFVSCDTVAVRVPNNPIARKLLRKAGPLTATSANCHNGSPPVTIDHAKKQLGSQVSCFLDGGSLLGIPSTIVDVATDFLILREGAIPAQEVYAYRN